MRMRSAFVALITALVALGALPGAPARAAEVKYDFEKCAQGWDIKKGGQWTRGRANPGSSNVSQVMGNTLYAESQERGDTITSQPHNWAGGKGKIKLRARWQFEWFPNETGGAGISTLDKAVLELSSDGGKKWKPVKAFSFPNASFPEFSDVEAPFDAPAGQFQLRFALYSDFSITSFGIEIDDVVVPATAPDGAACK